MRQQELERLQQANNRGHASPVDIDRLISAYRLLHSAMTERLNYDFARKDQPRQRTKKRTQRRR